MKSELILKEFNSSESKKKLNLAIKRSNNFSINEKNLEKEGINKKRPAKEKRRTNKE